MKLSGVVITHNEEQGILDCLKSLQFCDEIIVVDSGSTDQTVALARQMTANVYQKEWMGYSAQKNYANSLAKGEWILSVDADEVVPNSLASEIRQRVQMSSPTVGFLISRRTIHFGRWIRHGGWYPNRLLRLFKKSDGHWEGSDLHEYWKTTGKIETLKEDLIHHSFQNLSDQVIRNNRYSTLGPQSCAPAESVFLFCDYPEKPSPSFWKPTFLKLVFWMVIQDSSSQSQPLTRFS